MDRTRRRLVGAVAIIGALGGRVARADAFEVTRTDDEWLALLGRNRFEVLRRSATERPFTSPLDKEHRKGSFRCAGCELPLFSSDAKFDSRTGWPSFWQPLENAVGKTPDIASA